MPPQVPYHKSEVSIVDSQKRIMTLRWPLPQALPANITMHAPTAALEGNGIDGTACGLGLEIDAFFATGYDTLDAPAAVDSLDATMVGSVAYPSLPAHHAMPIAVQAGSAPSSPTKGGGAIASHTTTLAPKLIDKRVQAHSSIHRPRQCQKSSCQKASCQ